MNNLIYISHPCTSCGDIEENRKSAAEIADKLKEMGYSVVNPLAIINPDCDRDEAMKISYNLLSVCGTILMCGDWVHSSGCLAEMVFAIKKNINVSAGEWDKPQLNVSEQQTNH